MLQKYENDTQDRILRPDRKGYGAKHMRVIHINSWCSITWYRSQLFCILIWNRWYYISYCRSISIPMNLKSICNKTALDNVNNYLLIRVFYLSQVSKFFILLFFYEELKFINQETKRDNQYTGSVLAVYQNYMEVSESKNYSKLEKG